ncbi:helix-turn-helix domain-containing protein [Pseudalkalibacillus caeni]|uniref:ArsR family transcriptional regulator n=1 Tax=Exobacillus caeni TaxID=2574798 RepID=A0A5R9F0T9_9BACL|nr:helix-turn-helix domain-containing protein [Pseudalkalibacillus caeni]TLS36046.1 ArsR family transcriptional regulator [Pseudalkalibacillus caeni]
MSNYNKLTDMDLAKVMMDPRRNKIFELAKNKPVTVNDLAEAMDEKPSRLYYHVKKLEEAGFLELVETRQQGNLIEKFYKAVPGIKTFELDKSLLNEHSDDVQAEILKIVEPGLKKLFNELDNKEDRYKEQVDMAIHFSNLTGKEWMDSLGLMVEAIKDRGNNKTDTDSFDYQSKLGAEDLNKESKYVHLILTYKIEEE